METNMLHNATPVVLALQMPHLAGKVLAAGIGMWRLPHGSLHLTPAGNLLIPQGFLKRYANQPHTRLWIVIQTHEGTTRQVVLTILRSWNPDPATRLEAPQDLTVLADDAIERDTDPISYFVA